MTSKNNQAPALPVDIPKRWRALLENYFIKSALVMVLGGLASIIWLVLLPADEGNILLFGLSRNRLLMAGSVLLASLILLAAAYKWRGLDKRFFDFLLSGNNLSRWVIIGLAGLFVAGSLLLLSPFYRFWQFYYFTALIPFVAWLTLGLALCLLPAAILKWFAAAQGKKAMLDKHINIRRPLAVTMSILTAGAVLMVVSGLGFKPDTNFWNENGIPLLVTQILLSILISQLVLAGVVKFQNRFPRVLPSGIFLDAVIFLAIWVGGALLLNATPVVRTHFSPGPYPPNFTYYPISDALTYDRFAQQALLGEGFARGRHIGKPLLAAMLVFFHSLAGGDYNAFFTVQASFLAVIPAILYLIGKKLHGRAAGILAALFVLFLERNTYQGILYLSSSHSKLIMSEVPAALCITAALYFLVRGLGGKEGINLTALGVSAGVIGLSTMVRENAIILVPLPFLLVLFRNGLNGRNKINAILLMAVFLLAATTPWALRTYQVKGTPFYFAPKIQNVILNNRLLPLVDDETSMQNSLPLTAVKLDSPQIPSGMMTARLDMAMGLMPDFTRTDSASLQGPDPKPLGLVEAITQHLFHNLVTSFAILPVSPQLEDLTHAAQDRVNVFPGMNEGNALQPMTVLAILVNLFLLAVGISAAWKKKGLAGLAPLAVFLFYMLGLAAARSSGGRYIVTINWALLLYYAIGIGYCVLWLAARLGFGYADEELISEQVLPGTAKTIGAVKTPVLNITAGFMVLLVIGLMVPLTEKIFPKKYPNETDPLAVQALYEQNLISADTFEAYQRLTHAGDLTVMHGRLLYPRFYLAGEEVSRKSGTGFRKMDFPRLHFMLQGGSSSHVILPLGEQPGHVPDSADTLVVGCEGRVFFAKLALVYDRDSGQYIPLWWDETQPDPCIADW